MVATCTALSKGPGPQAAPSKWPWLAAPPPHRNRTHPSKEAPDPFLPQPGGPLAAGLARGFTPPSAEGRGQKAHCLSPLTSFIMSKRNRRAHGLAVQMPPPCPRPGLHMALSGFNHQLWLLTSASWKTRIMAATRGGGHGSQAGKRHLFLAPCPSLLMDGVAFAHLGCLAMTLGAGIWLYSQIPQLSVWTQGPAPCPVPSPC